MICLRRIAVGAVGYIAIWVASLAGVQACELCAVYSSADARGGFSSGFLVSVSESFTANQTVQLDGKEITLPQKDFLNTSITHLVGTYNFSDRFGVSLNLPVAYHDFERSEIRYSDTSTIFRVERGKEVGLGDLALVGRATVFRKKSMDWGVSLNVMGGVKFPTGDADRIRDEVDQARRFEALLPPNTPHDPLAHAVSGLHEHALTLGSGSFDGIAGATLNARWQRSFVNLQFQYYARTEGESGFRFGDELMVSGGPGQYLVVNDKVTLSLEASAYYESSARDKLLGQKSDFTGRTAWLLGPLLNFTWADRLTANVGVDIPLEIASHGLQLVPTYRVHGGVSWRF